MKNINFSFIKKEKSLEPAMAYPVSYIRDWKVMVLCFAVGLIALSIFSWRIYLSNRIAGGYLSTEAPAFDMVSKNIDQKKLRTDTILLETRQTDFNKIKSGYVKLVDPSL